MRGIIHFLWPGCIDNSDKYSFFKGVDIESSVIDDDSNVDENEYLFLSASQDQKILLWRFTTLNSSKDDDGDNIIDDSDAKSAILLHQFKGHARSVDALAVSPNRQEVFTFDFFETRLRICVLIQFCSVSWDTYLKIWSAGMLFCVSFTRYTHVASSYI